MADNIPAWQAQAEKVRLLERMLNLTAAQYVEPDAGVPIAEREQAITRQALGHCSRGRISWVSEPVYASGKKHTHTPPAAKQTIATTNHHTTPRPRR